VINGLDTSEVESIAKDFSDQYPEDSKPKEGLKNEISKILEAPVPHTNLNGIGFHRPRGTKIVSVGFSYNEAGDKGELEGNTAAYAYISGSYQCYIRCQVCPKDGDMYFCQNGVRTSEEFTRGDTVIDKNTISFLNPKTGKYTDVKASVKALGKYLEKIKETNPYQSSHGDSKNQAKEILKQYQAMQIKVTSQVNRVDFEQEEPDIERKVSIMHKGRILSYNAEEPKKIIAKKKIAKEVYDVSSTEKFVKINEILLPDSKFALPVYVKLSIEDEETTQQSEPFVLMNDGKYQELTCDIIKKNNFASTDHNAEELLSRVKNDCKNTKLILPSSIFDMHGDMKYKISTPKDFTGAGTTTSPSSSPSPVKVNKLSEVSELWIQEKKLNEINR
jgi:hypothetical protein